MDPLTHTLLGAVVARTSLGGSTRLAGLALMVSANLPDLDVLSYVAGPDYALGFRRGWTHGPLGILILPAVLAACLLGMDAVRRARAPDLPRPIARRVLALAYLGCLTHPFLDWLNTYGVRLLMPFDGQWFYGDAVFIIDPWLWLILGGTVVIAARPRLGGSIGWLVLAILMSVVLELGAGRIPSAVRPMWFAGIGAIVLLRLWPRTMVRATTVAGIGLLLASAYIGTMLIASTSAGLWVRGELNRQGVGEVHDLMIGPLPADPLAWDVLAETETAYRYGTFRWLPRPSLELSPRVLEKPRSSPLLDAALTAPQIQGALDWMRFPFVEIESTDRGHTVYVIDARYVRRRGSGFGTAVVELDSELRVLGAR